MTATEFKVWVEDFTTDPAKPKWLVQVDAGDDRGVIGRVIVDGPTDLALQCALPAMAAAARGTTPVHVELKAVA